MGGHQKSASRYVSFLLRFAVRPRSQPDRSADARVLDQRCDFWIRTGLRGKARHRRFVPRCLTAVFRAERIENDDGVAIAARSETALACATGVFHLRKHLVDVLSGHHHALRNRRGGCLGGERLRKDGKLVRQRPKRRRFHRWPRSLRGFRFSKSFAPSRRPFGAGQRTTRFGCRPSAARRAERVIPRARAVCCRFPLAASSAAESMTLSACRRAVVKASFVVFVFIVTPGYRRQRHRRRRPCTCHP